MCRDSSHLVARLIASRLRTGTSRCAAPVEMTCAGIPSTILIAAGCSYLNVETASSFWVMNSSRAGVPSCVRPIARVMAGMICSGSLTRSP